MTTSKNDITGDDIKSKAASAAYRDNYDRIFGNKQRSFMGDIIGGAVLASRQELEQKLLDAVPIYKRQTEIGELWNIDEAAAPQSVQLSQQQQAAVDDTAGLEK